MKKTLLWLDDYRDPLKDDWLVFSPIGRDLSVFWVKTYAQFIAWIYVHGLPDGICFDHDLGEHVNNRTGYDCAKWLVDYCIRKHKKLPLYAIHSANPVGKKNIDMLLKNYIKHCEEK